MKQVDLSTLSRVELQSLAYEQLVELERIQKNLNAINAQLAALKQEETKVVVENKSKEKKK